MDSHRVIARCFQITPLENQAKIWLATSTGLEKKNGGSSMRPNTGTVASNCHNASAIIATSTCSETSLTFDIASALPFSITRSRFEACRLRVTLHHFRFETAPYLRVKRVKFLVQPALKNAPGPCGGHPPVADDTCARPGRHDHHA